MKIKNSKRDLVFLLVLLLAVFIRISVAFISYKNNVMANFSDDNAYMQYANSILEQGPLVLDIEKLSSTEKVIGPGLPWIIATFKTIFRGSWLSIFILNAFVGAFTCMFIFLLGKEILNRKVALWSALWSAFYVLSLKYVSTAGKEVWMTFLFTAIILLILKIRKNDLNFKHKYLPILLLAGVFSLLIHVDERYFAYFPLIPLFLIWMDQDNWFTGLKKSLAFVFIVLLLMTPWLVRNYYVYQKPVILSVRTAPLTDKVLGIKSERYIEPLEGRWYLSDSQIKKALKGEPVFRKNQISVKPDQLKAMKDGIIPHKFSKLESAWSVFQILWKPVDLNRGYSTTGYRYDGAWSLKHNLSIGLTYGLLIPFFLWGLILLFYNKKKVGIFFFSVLAYHSLIHMLFIPYTRNRYHIPVDAIIIVVGIYGMINIIDLFKLKYFRNKDHKI